MVSQKLVQEVMEKLDRPCTAKDITDYIMDNKLLNIARNSIRNDVCGVLNTLRKWYTVEKFPDLHGTDSNKWYLINNGLEHDSKTCEKCKAMRVSHNKHIGDMASKSAWRKRKNSEEQDEDFYKDLSAPRWGRGSDV